MDKIIKAGRTSSNADMEQPGALPSGSYFLTLDVQGAHGHRSWFAIIDGKLVETTHVGQDGEPDWSTVTVCDPLRGDPELFHPVFAVLRFMNTTWRSISAWRLAERHDIEAQFAELGIRAWRFDEDVDAYVVNQHPDGSGGTQLSTSEAPGAYLAGVRSARDSDSADATAAQEIRALRSWWADLTPEERAMTGVQL